MKHALLPLILFCFGCKSMTPSNCYNSELLTFDRQNYDIEMYFNPIDSTFDLIENRRLDATNRCKGKYKYVSKRNIVLIPRIGTHKQIDFPDTLQPNETLFKIRYWIEVERNKTNPIYVRYYQISLGNREEYFLTQSGNDICIFEVGSDVKCIDIYYDSDYHYQITTDSTFNGTAWDILVQNNHIVRPLKELKLRKGYLYMWQNVKLQECSHPKEKRVSINRK